MQTYTSSRSDPVARMEAALKASDLLRVLLRMDSGRERPRSELQVDAGLTDRELVHARQWLCDRGVTICASSSDGRTVWWVDPDTRSDAIALERRLHLYRQENAA